MFTHESVEALLDLMARDPTVGAVLWQNTPFRGWGPLCGTRSLIMQLGIGFQKVPALVYKCCHSVSLQNAAKHGLVLGKGSESQQPPLAFPPPKKNIV